MDLFNSQSLLYYKHKSTERQREKERQTDRQTDRHTKRERETDRQRQRQTDRQTESYVKRSKRVFIKHLHLTRSRSAKYKRNRVVRIH